MSGRYERDDSDPSTVAYGTPGASVGSSRSSRGSARSWGLRPRPEGSTEIEAAHPGALPLAPVVGPVAETAEDLAARARLEETKEKLRRDPKEDWANPAYTNTAGKLDTFYGKASMADVLTALDLKATQFADAVTVNVDGQMRDVYEKIEKLGDYLEFTKDGDRIVKVHVTNGGKYKDFAAAEAVFNQALDYVNAKDDKERAKAYYVLASILSKSNAPGAWDKITTTWTNLLGINRALAGLRSLATLIRDNINLVQIGLPEVPDQDVLFSLPAPAAAQRPVRQRVMTLRIH